MSESCEDCRIRKEHEKKRCYITGIVSWENLLTCIFNIIDRDPELTSWDAERLENAAARIRRNIKDKKND